MHFRLSWSVKHVISFVTWSVNHVTCLVNHVTSFVEMTSEAAFFRAGRSADALKAEKPGPVRSNGENPGRCRSEVGTKEL